MLSLSDAPVNEWCGIDAFVNDVRCTSGLAGAPSQQDRCDASLYIAERRERLPPRSRSRELEGKVSASDRVSSTGARRLDRASVAIAAQRASRPRREVRHSLTDGNPTSCGDEGISNDISHVVDVAAVGLDGKGGARPHVRHRPTDLELSPGEGRRRTLRHRRGRRYERMKGCAKNDSASTSSPTTTSPTIRRRSSRGSARRRSPARSICRRSRRARPLAAQRAAREHARTNSTVARSGAQGRLGSRRTARRSSSMARPAAR